MRLSVLSLTNQSQEQEQNSKGIRFEFWTHSSESKERTDVNGVYVHAARLMWLCCASVSDHLYEWAVVWRCDSVALFGQWPAS